MGASIVLGAGCGDEGPVDPSALRFGQIGDVRVELVTPLRLGKGELRQVINWSSDGPWSLTESISYRGTEGDSNLELSLQSPEVLAGSYAQWITQVNEVPSLTLFVEGLEPGFIPACGPTRTRAMVSIRDVPRAEELRWTVCVSGSLENVVTTDASPNVEAARVAQAVILARDFTLGSSFFSLYSGSVPFATVARGDDTNAELDDPLVFIDEPSWEAFWLEHAGPSVPPPAVDFGEDHVIVGAVGLRMEAGDTVEIRRVLPIDVGTRVELVERIPGDFCSPAALQHFPFHMVLVPAVPTPVTFNDLAVERVTCGR